MKVIVLPVFLLVLIAHVAHIYGEGIDVNEIEQFCYPAQHKNSRKSCECTNDNAPPWSLLALRIDCSYNDLKIRDLDETLPLYVDTLDLSWNALVQVPSFASDSLRQLNLMHNNISRIISKNFVKISNLKELYLNWNSIQSVELNAFDDLAHLQVLDLSHNNLHALSARIFAPMLVLETLSLSWNRQLNYTTSIQDVDFYQSFGVNTNLRSLQLEACSLSNFVLPEHVPLVELNMRRNLLRSVPQKLPKSLQKIDLSENLLQSLVQSDTEFLRRVQELFLEDMPFMDSVAENAFLPLQSLRKVSFQNSRRLNTINGNAFGVNVTQFPPLQSMIFRGTTLRTFNSTLAPVFKQLTELDLNGVPLQCDCELIWVKELALETNGRCFKPARLRGRRLSDAKVSDFSCDRWPRWLYGIITLGLLIICAGGIYLVVMGLRPHRGVTMRSKVGASSPYARVTVEPNRQENL